MVVRGDCCEGVVVMRGDHCEGAFVRGGHCDCVTCVGVWGIGEGASGAVCG